MVLAVDALMALSEPLQRHVGSQHAHLAPLTVVDMRQIARRQLPRGGTVEVGWCPVALRIIKGTPVPCVYQVVGVILVHLPAFDHVGRVAPGIDLKVMAFLGEDVGLEDESAARHILVLSHHALQMLLQLVGVVDVALYVVDIVDGSHVDVREHTPDPLIRVEEDALIARFGLTSHTLSRDQVDAAHDGCRCQQQYRHDSETQSVCKRPFLHSLPVFLIVTYNLSFFLF